MRILFFIFLSFVITISGLQAQETKNPFDLAYRLKYFDKEEIKEEIPSIDSAIAAPIDSTGIDSAAVNQVIDLEDETSNNDPESEQATRLNSEEEQHLISQPTSNQTLKRSYLFWILLFLLLLLTFMVSINRVVLSKISKSLINDNYLNLVWREQKGNVSTQYLILYFLFIINAGLFFYLSLEHYNVRFNNWTLLTCILIVALIYFLRHSTMGILSFIFPIQKEINQFNFTIMIFNIFLGMCLLPLNAIIAFAPDQFASFTLFFCMILVVVLYIYRQLRGLFIGRSFLLFRKFHFFIYLCAIEIAPLLVLVKFTNSLIQS